ncbi:MAG: hypothetical protein JRJ19_14650, partial [Deltaproteobacteria bacterium]|nr:hypothetical protein [Deltaproteobacteria bacterium]
TFSVNSLAPDIAKHEFGHSFGGLADEYETAYPGYPDCSAVSDCPEPNVTIRTLREEIKWNIWIDAATPVPTPETAPYAAVVGLFEGARYQSSGVYRSRQNCMMRSLGPAFCDICSQAMVLSAYDTVNPIDSTTPNSPVNLSACDNQTLTVAYPQPIPDSMLITWRVNGSIEATGVTQFAADAMTLGDGSHTIRVEVADGTTLVREDLSQLLIDEYTWTINVSGSGQGACMIDGECYSGGALNPINPCQECDPNSNQTAWTNNDSNDCSDGSFCNGAETCLSGTCQAGLAPCSDDGLACTATCDEGTQQCNLIDPAFCLIDNACVADGALNSTNPCQECLAAVDNLDWSDDDSNSCEDQDFCNGQETCQSGSCVSGAASCSDDGLDCTTTCDQGTQECNLIEPGSCVIDAGCLAAETINPANPCLECMPATSQTDWSNDDSNSCSDGLFCNGAESCVGGTCQDNPDPCTGAGLDCTITCDESSQQCEPTDSAICLIDGACVAQGSPNPDNPCQECIPTGSNTSWTDVDTNSCSDGDACTENDFCSAGICQSGSKLCSEACPCNDVSGGCSCASSGRLPYASGWLLLFGLLGLLLIRRKNTELDR